MAASLQFTVSIAIHPAEYRYRPIVVLTVLYAKHNTITIDYGIEPSTTRTEGTGAVQTS